MKVADAGEAHDEAEECTGPGGLLKSTPHPQLVSSPSAALLFSHQIQLSGHKVTPGVTSEE